MKRNGFAAIEVLIVVAIIGIIAAIAIPTWVMARQDVAASGWTSAAMECHGIGVLHALGPSVYACCDKKNDNLLYATHNGITVVVDGCKEVK